MTKIFCFFHFLSSQRIFSFFWPFFCSSLSPPVSRFEWWSLFFILRASHCTRPPNFTHVWPIHPPPSSAPSAIVPAHPLPPEIARVPPSNPSFCFSLGPIVKGWSTTACPAVGAGPSKVPPQTPYLSPPSISLTLTYLFLLSRPKKAQHFPVRKVVRLP